ncbi:MAG: hemolysin III family protein [Clostridia bacterium]|nr:hemolysin III family protein [Clostridia bacterium]
MFFYNFFQRARDPLSSYTHFIGACLSVIGIIVIMLRGGDGLCGLLVFAFCMLALYATSCSYHFVKASDEVIERVRKLDHAMIFVLISGSYTPLILKFMSPERIPLFLCIFWGITLLGIIIKVFWLHAPRWLYTSLYVLMGWGIVFDPSFFFAIPTGGIILLAAGGLMYTVGALCYALKKPNLPKGFGFHEIFHLFVIAGSFLHYIMLYNYTA